MVQQNRTHPPTDKGNEKILIIDDDPTIRMTLSEMIMALGFRVEWAESGEEGLNKHKTALGSGEPFDLIITDMTFPAGMDGQEILSAARRLEPQVKVIVSSGFTSDYDLTQYEQSGFNAFLLKPFGMKALQQTIINVLAD